MDGRFYRREQLERIWREDDEHRYGDMRLVKQDFEHEHDEAASNVNQSPSLLQREVKPIREGLDMVLRVNGLMGKYDATAELLHSEPIRPSGTLQRNSNRACSRGHETVEAAVAALAALESEVMTNAGSVATG